MQTQSHIYDTAPALLSPLQAALHKYVNTIPGGNLVTKKRYLARLRCDIRLECDSEYKRFYALVVDTPFKSVMRNNLTIAINY